MPFAIIISIVKITGNVRQRLLYMRRIPRGLAAMLLGAALLLAGMQQASAAAPPITNPQSGSVGVQGTLPTEAPKVGATISVPGNSQSFTSVPITVSGICPTGLLVKIFKNNVFAGSVMCVNGSFSLQIDLFSGQNDLIARVYDALDQPGPDSNTVTVSFNDARPTNGPRISLTSNYAKRGANPGEKLTWPITVTGGTVPYAISVDWGDGKAPDLISRPFPGELILSHIYDSPGVYNIIIKATDKDGNAAFLQLVGVANGALSQTNSGTDANGTKTIVREKVLLWPFLLVIPLLLTSFWLGKRYELRRLRKLAEAHSPY